MTRTARRMRKYLLVVACIALVMGVAIGGTVAWLQDTTSQVTNTFTPSNISVELDEPTVDTDKNFQIIPGVDITKDPEVSASSNVDYYVFVKVTETNWLSGMAYTVDTANWTLLTAGTGETLNGVGTNDKVYYKKVSAGTSLTGVAVLTDDKVTVANTITDDTLEALTKDTYPKLTFTAYAIQQANGTDSTFSPVEAWNTLNTTTAG